MKIFKNTLKLTLLVCIMVVSFSCSSSDDDGPAPAPIRTADDVRADFQNLTIVPGINDLTLESLIVGRFWNFRIIAPANASASNKMPLVMSLHGGASANVPNAHKTTNCLVEPGFAEMEAYIISPNSNGMLWYEEFNVIQVQALVDLVSSYLHVDTSRTVITGYSDGGNGSWFYSQYFPQLFTAAIPMASSYATSSQSGIIHQFANPLYVIHGYGDELFPVEITEGYVNDAISVGSDITFVVADGLDHYSSCDYVTYLQDAVTWLEDTIWST